MPWEVGRGSGPVPPVSVEPKQTLKTDRRGAVIVEMALVLPLLVTLLLGLVCYGQYFLIAHSVQQIANDAARATIGGLTRSEEHTSELQSLMRISYAVFCLKKKKKHILRTDKQYTIT